MIVMFATLPVAEDRRDEAVALATDLAEETRAEPGVVDYRVAADVADPATLRFFERYEDEAAVDAHMASDHFQRFQGEVADLLAGEPTLVRFDVDSATELL